MIESSNVSDAGWTALRAFVVSLGAVVVSACATLQAREPAKPESAAAATAAAADKPSATPAPESAKPAAGAAAAATPPGAPRPFAEVVKDAKVIQGLFPIWQKDDKAWIEIPADMEAREIAVLSVLGYGDPYLA